MRQWARACPHHSGSARWGGEVASQRASAGARSEAPKLKVNIVREEALGAHRLGPGGSPSSLEDEGGSEDEDERVDEADLGVALMRMGPWNRRAFQSHSGNGFEVRCSYCPRRKGGSFVGC